MVLTSLTECKGTVSTKPAAGGNNNCGSGTYMSLNGKIDSIKWTSLEMKTCLLAKFKTLYPDLAYG